MKLIETDNLSVNFKTIHKMKQGMKKETTPLALHKTSTLYNYFSFSLSLFFQYFLKAATV